MDDEESQRDVMSRFLKKLGYDATISSNALEALELLKKEYFPLVITDLSMPGMDGSTLCKNIRLTNPNAIIYALSGFIESAEFETFESARFDGYLRKPVTSKVLKLAIEDAFEKLQRNAEH
ncbi:MAG: response regulator [Desulfobacterales bacterium]